MAVNPSPSQLDASQITQRTFDASNDAIRTVPAETTAFSIELDATDGDSIQVVGTSSSTKASLTNASTGVVVPAASCAGTKSFNLYTKTTATITGPQACTLEVSPHDTDDVWIATTLTITPSATLNDVVMGTANSSIVARRARVSITAAITTGTFDIYLVKQGI